MNSESGHALEPNPANIFDTLNAYQKSAALKAAIELDLFTAIARGHNDADAIAKAISASERGTRMLCDYLTLNGFLMKAKDQYSLNADAAMFLDKSSPAYMGSVALFMLDPRLISPYLELGKVVRDGKTTLPGEGTVSHDNPIWVDFAKQMAPMIYPSALEIAELVGGDGELRVLDLAAGHGLFGISVARRNAKAQITAVDWQNVLAVASENAKKFGVAERHHLLPGDAFGVAFGGPYDLAFVTNFFHHFDRATCEQLMRKVFAALAPGGRCVTLDFVPNDDRVSPPTAAGFGMMMLGTTTAGDVYTFAEYEAMFRNSGFQSSELHQLKRAAQSVIVSTKG